MPELRVWSVRPQDIPKVLRGLAYLPIETLLGEPQVIETAERVAWRYAHEKVGAFFNVGDLILYGKYKNKKGRIIAFSTNDKGQPIVEIEPIPKGRKKNKVMGLFKIWNVAVIEQAAQAKEQAMSLTAQRVASRFILAKNLPMGETIEVGSIRIHRYRDHFKVTDLTFAGKRGKKVRVMTIGPSYSYKGDQDGWMDRISKAITDYDTYDQIKAFINDLLVDYPREIDLHESAERGIDVSPVGRGKVQLKTTTGLDITAEEQNFILKSTVWFDGPPGKPGFNQDTLYYSAGKKDAQLFYNWLVANEAEAKRMTLDDFRKLWKDLGVRYDYH